jgi:tRNA threonylcarbamoyladenosine biosynthesis protein TsaE
MAELQLSFVLHDENETEDIAKRIAASCLMPLVVTFGGQLGVGKTTLIRFMLRALGVSGAIKSPTFSLVESYMIPSAVTIHHFDLYRIADEAELDYIGFRDYFSTNTLCCIEWPERAPHVLSLVDLHCSLAITDQAHRILTISAKSANGLICLSNLVGLHA